jgi:CBS-domain-containing membrane protein|tara:strand:- start:34131 stop:34595 length:465 start_codon:yes stop_codon:yes gene_type:complete
MATKARNRKSTRRSPGAQAARNVTCGQTMQHAHSMLDSDSMALVLDSLTQNNWDHIFIVDHEGAPMGRLHAVDLLKLIARKTVNRDIAWMHSIPAQQLLNHPPLTVRVDTPLLKAGALMLTHDINQLGVVDREGTLVGVVGHNTLAKVMPRFIL